MQWVTDTRTGERYAVASFRVKSGVMTIADIEGENEALKAKT